MEKPDNQSDNHWSLLQSVLLPFFLQWKQPKAPPLPGSESEAHDIEYLLSSSQVGGKSCQVHVAIGSTYVRPGL